MYSGEEAGWGDYGVQGDFMGELIQSMMGLNYVPSMAPTGSASSYWPGDVSADAEALTFVGFPVVGALPSRGSQSADMAAGAGAWSAPFKAAVLAFQKSRGLAADGWIGLATRTALGAAVAQKNASESPIVPPYPAPLPTPIPIPNLVPNQPPSNLGSGPAVPGIIDRFMALPLWEKLAIGGAAVAVLGGGVYYATK